MNFKVYPKYLSGFLLRRDDNLYSNISLVELTTLKSIRMSCRRRRHLMNFKVYPKYLSGFLLRRNDNYILISPWLN